MKPSRFLVALVSYVIFLGGCGGSDGGSGEGGEGAGGPPTQTKEQQDTLLSAGNALAAGDMDEFTKWLSDNMPAPPENAVPPPAIETKKLGDAIKIAKLIYSSDYYAFFEIMVDGEAYPLTLVWGEDGQWKIDQF